MTTYRVTGIYTTSEETCAETFTDLEKAKAYYEELIVELEDEQEGIDYITIYVSDEDGYSISNIETYTYN